jgi:hypothetical protein
MAAKVGQTSFPKTAKNPVYPRVSTFWLPQFATYRLFFVPLAAQQPPCTQAVNH